MVAYQVGHIDLSRRIFCYLKNYPKQGYAINPQPLNVDVEYEKVKMKYDFGNQYAYFNEEISEQLPERLLDELEINVFADTDHRWE